MSVIDFESIKVWSQIPRGFKLALLTNAFCPHCKRTSFAQDYRLHMDGYALIIEGHCAQCGLQIEKRVDSYDR